MRMGKPYEHLMRLTTPMKYETGPQSNTKYLESVADQLGYDWSETETDFWGADAQSNDGRNTRADGRRDQSVFVLVLAHSCSMCWDRADAQLEVSILGSYLRAPTTGAKEALRRVTRYLLGTKDAYIKLSVQNGDRVLVELAGDPVSRKSQSSGHVDADGCPVASF